MTMLIQHGRRRGSSKSAEETSRLFQAPDLRQVKVLPRAEWLRIQDELNKVNKDKESIREAAKQREALHLQSKEVVKKWSNTIAGQRQKKLEAKKIREQAEEERRKQTDIEEAKYQEEKRKEVIEKAKTQLYYQTDRVRGLHSALLLTEVLKEREAQIELKERIKSSSKDVDKEYIAVAKARDDEALRKEQEKKLEKKSVRKAVAEAQKKQITQIDLVREQQKMETRKDGEENQRLKALYQWEQKLEEEKLTEQKRNLMQAHLEHISNRNLIRAEKAKKLEEEDEKRKLFLSTKQKMMKMRKDKEAEIIRELQMHRERIIDRLTASQQEQTISEEQRIANAVAEQEEKRERRRREEEERRAGMLKSITAHREMMRQEKEQRDKEMQQNAREMLQAIQEADRIYSDKQKLKSQKSREEHKKLQDFNATQMAAKIARQQQLKEEDQGFEVKNRDLVAEEEKHFQQYSRHVIGAAAEVQRNVIPLCKAAREGIGGGHGPVFGGLRPSYLVQDCTGAQMPTYVSTHTQNIKTLHDVTDIQGAKKRLGFIWAL